MLQIFLVSLLALNGNVLGRHVRSIDPYNTPSTVIPQESLYYHTSETGSSNNDNYNQKSEYQQPKVESSQYEAPKTYQPAIEYYPEPSPVVKFVFTQDHGNGYYVQPYQHSPSCNCQQNGYGASNQYQSGNEYGERDANPHLHGHSSVHTHIHQKGVPSYPLAHSHGVLPVTGGYGTYPAGFAGYNGQGYAVPSKIHGHQTIHSKFRNGAEKQENDIEEEAKKKSDDLKKEKVEQDKSSSLKANASDPSTLDKANQSEIVGMNFLQGPELMKPFLGRISNEKDLRQQQLIHKKTENKSNFEPIVGSTNIQDLQNEFDHITQEEQSQSARSNNEETEQTVGTFNMNLSDAMMTPFAGQADQDDIDDMMATYNNFNYNFAQNNLDNHNMQMMQMF